MEAACATVIFESSHGNVPPSPGKCVLFSLTFLFFSELTRYSRNEISPGAISHMKETPLCEKRGPELLMIQRAFNDRSRRCTLCGLVEKGRKGTGNTCIVQGSRN